jgi:hypothetical protein
MAGWVHIKFKKPLIMNGFSLTSSWNQRTYPKNFRFYAKVIRDKDQLVPVNKNCFGPVAGFDLLKNVKNENFQYQQNRLCYGFDGGMKHLIISEIKLMIDSTMGGNKANPELY